MDEAHLPNTGRCKELLIDGAIVYLLPSDNPNRKTKYSLHFVENNGALVAMYSQNANNVVIEGIKKGLVKELEGYDIVDSEKTIGNSRIDIYLANKMGSDDYSEDSYDDSSKYSSKDSSIDLVDETYVEVKSVTLIKDGIAQFPDAPTERGRKHLQELINLKKEGFRTVVFFLIQHPNGNSFRPNWENDPEFSKTLVEAYDNGVEILVYKSENTLDKISLIDDSLEFNLSK